MLKFLTRLLILITVIPIVGMIISLTAGVWFGLLTILVSISGMRWRNPIAATSPAANLDSFPSPQQPQQVPAQQAPAPPFTAPESLRRFDLYQQAQIQAQPGSPDLTTLARFDVVATETFEITPASETPPRSNLRTTWPQEKAGFAVTRHNHRQ